MIRVVLPFYSEFDTLKPSLRALKESDIPHEVQMVQGAFVAKSRNSGVTASQVRFQTLPKHITHYLFLDSDIAFTVADVRAAMAHDAPILGLPYFRHEGDGTYQAAGAMSAQGQLSLFLKAGIKGLQRIPFIGAGFLLVKREALETMAYPWFHHRVLNIEEMSENCGNDVGFCLAAREAGIPILCDFDRPVYHRLRRREHFDVSY